MDSSINFIDSERTFIDSEKRNKKSQKKKKNKKFPYKKLGKYRCTPVKN